MSENELEKNVVLTLFALLIGVTALIVVVKYIDPLSSEQGLTAKVANSLAMDIDSMSSVEEGRIETTMDPEKEMQIKVGFQKSGQKEGYIIDEDGWYVIASMMKLTKRIVMTSRIRTYPSSWNDELRDHEMDMFKPQKICVVKERGKKYAYVKEWLLGC